MKTPLMNKSPITLIMSNSLIKMPLPTNISNFWNFGSLLGLCLIIQIMTGLFLAMQYSAHVELAFNSVIHICRDVKYGWLMRTLHANGASFFFICLYLHVGRGMYFNSFNLMMTWTSGIIILFLIMATAFLGYVLPWGQMSFWGATVITNLLSAIPYLGNELVTWLWGGFSVNNATLTRFFTLHFILPLITTMLIMIHLMFLHQSGSNNPLGTNSNIDKIPLHPLFTYKDLLGYTMMMSMLMILTLSNPYMLSDPDNFTPANPMITPAHIQPEWYFLFAYAILRSIPNKLGGVIMLFTSILILLLIPFTTKKKLLSNSFYPISKILFWSFLTIFILLTWLGANPVEQPFIIISQMITVMYFSYFIVNSLTLKMWDKITL